jgi:hypothetical protein
MVSQQLKLLGIIRVDRSSLHDGLENGYNMGRRKACLAFVLFTFNSSFIIGRSWVEREHALVPSSRKSSNHQLLALVPMLSERLTFAAGRYRHRSRLGTTSGLNPSIAYTSYCTQIFWAAVSCPVVAASCPWQPSNSPTMPPQSTPQLEAKGDPIEKLPAQ